MQVIPPSVATATRPTGHPVLDAIGRGLAARLADTIEKPIPRNLAAFLAELDCTEEESDRGPKRK
jgi:hypothetical protein